MNDALQNSRFMKAVRREPVDTTPVWIMRQAGRYLPEYMAVRSKTTFIELCKTPELACEVTLSAQRILNADAAILFADLLPILEPMGIDLEYVKGEGPVIHNPLQEPGAVDRLTALDSVDMLDYVFQAVKLIRSELPSNIPLLGFAGAPFTLASYCIEGGGSKNYVHTKTLMYNDAGAWNALMSKLVDSVSIYLKAQIAAGCQAVQVFDSWAGCLSPADYREYVLPHTKRLIASVIDDAPVINFLTGNPALLPLQKEAGGTVMGVDWRVQLDDAWKTFGPEFAIQGNMDPVSIYAELPILKQRVKDVLDAAGGRPGHIFNLGHGVMPDMNPDHVKAVVEYVHELGAR
ncbi:uroporphyrinogen decarboxylase [Fuerstiella marisgermanici]|uniref:Uroporphyrinogen decarboxylase n=1 Tax=Fuerstiella marisgermanici TaxID=1891926 RepID=A0A1P8WIA5_9PLAN|nr:uroporphyrinogen decarboxylase [Fuerstiella marisgermanici]APZ93773.1 Uroporphyrinogen decarboxylase [Fuerstiella marisgermanici]